MKSKKLKFKNLEATSVKILFFDIGGVLLSNGWGHEARKEAADKFGLDYEEVNALHSFIFNVYDSFHIDFIYYKCTIFLMLQT